MTKVLYVWFPFIFLSTIFSLLVYTAVQQDLRQGGNDPQIQIAEDGERALTRGVNPDSLVPAVSDMKESLAPYVIIFDASGIPVISGTRLEGVIPVPPKGVFDYLATHTENRFTWEPEHGVRQAVVMEKVSDGRFILAGRSLREVEKRVGTLGFITFFFWLGSVVLTFIYSFFITRRHH